MRCTKKLWGARSKTLVPNNYVEAQSIREQKKPNSQRKQKTRF